MAPAPRLLPALVVLLLTAAVGPCAAAGRGGGRVDLWPMPGSVTRGAQTLHVSRDLKLSAAGSNYSDGRGILKDAFARMLAVVVTDHVVNGSYQGAPMLAGVNVVVRSPDDKVRTRFYGAAEGAITSFVFSGPF